MASTKWRVRGLSPYGTGAVSLSGLQLYAGASRVDDVATITCSHTPSSGSLANLQDADTSTLCSFARADCLTSGFWIQWEFGTAQDITGIRVGSGAVQNTFLSDTSLEFWSTATARWEPLGIVGRFAWPGANTLSTEISFTELTNLTQVLLHLNGANGVAPSGAIDSSINGFLASNAQACTYSNAIAGKFYSTSLLFNTTATPILYIGPTAPTALDLQTEDFGFDLWVNPITIAHSGNACCLFGSYDGPRTGTYGLFLDNGKINLYVENFLGPGPFHLLGTTVLPINTWTHVAVTREGNTFRAFVNGVLDATATSSHALIVSPTRPLNLGSYFYGGGGPYGRYNGYMQELRIVRGRAPWTANFTPPAAPYQALGGALPIPMTPIGIALGQIFGVSPAAPNSVTPGIGVAPSRDIYFVGDGVVYGTTEVDGSPDFPKVCKVRLCRERDGYVVSEQWSKADGTWRFPNLNREFVYKVEAFDHTHNYRAVIADNLVPELML